MDETLIHLCVFKSKTYCKPLEKRLKSVLIDVKIDKFYYQPTWSKIVNNFILPRDQGQSSSHRFVGVVVTIMKTDDFPFFVVVKLKFSKDISKNRPKISCLFGYFAIVNCIFIVINVFDVHQKFFRHVFWQRFRFWISVALNAGRRLKNEP